MSAYTFVSVYWPGFLKTRLGHELFWLAVKARRHVEATRKAFEEAGK